MSRKIVDRVWKHSGQSGANKLLLLALAEQADDDGFTWVGYKTLAPMVGVIERQVYRLVDNLIKKGELLVWEQQGQHGGRGYTNIYFVTTGLTQEQIADVVRIRFDLVSNEVGAVIDKKGDIYIKLCDVKRVAPATLERTRKSGGYVTLEDEKGYQKPDTSVTQKDEPKPIEEQKPDTSVTRLLKESLIIESNPSKESNRGVAPPQNKPSSCLAPHTQALMTICKLDWEFVKDDKSTLRAFNRIRDFLIKQGATPGDIAEFDLWRQAHHWTGNSPPRLTQVGELWPQYQEWVKAGKPAPIAQQKNGAYQNGRHKTTKIIPATGEQAERLKRMAAAIAADDTG